MNKLEGRHALITGWCLYDLGRAEVAAELVEIQEEASKHRR